MQDDAVATLERAGQPVVRIAVTDRYHIGQEFFRWEFATAVAGSILGIDPFDQPDVEASKVKTRELTAAYEKTGKLPAETPFLEEAGLALFADGKNVRDFTKVSTLVFTIDSTASAPAIPDSTGRSATDSITRPTGSSRKGTSGVRWRGPVVHPQES